VSLLLTYIHRLLTPSVRFKIVHEAAIDEKENEPTSTDWTGIFIKRQRGTSNMSGQIQK
jgi:hypothetical protein